MEKNFQYKPTDFKSSALSPDFRSSVNHVLIIRPGALGDLIVTLPTLGAIRNHFCNAQIEIMGYTTYLELVKGRFYADAVSRFDQADITPLFVKNVQIPTSLIKRFGSMDLIIAFVSDNEHVLVNNLKATGARRVSHYEPFPSESDQIHIVDHFLKFLNSVGIPYSDEIPKIFLQNDDILFGNDFMKDKIVNIKKYLVAIHPGSGSRQKCWPVDYFAELIIWLKDKMGILPIIVAGPSDIEIVERLRLKVKDNFILADRLPLPGLAAIIKRCNLFVGNDSGITHLAAAVGTRTIAIFGSTDSNIWGPRGEQVRILCKKFHCNPCLPDTRRNCFSPVCLDTVTVDDVIREVRSILV